MDPKVLVAEGEELTELKRQLAESAEARGTWASTTSRTWGFQLAGGAVG